MILPALHLGLCLKELSWYLVLEGWTIETNSPSGVKILITRFAPPMRCCHYLPLNMQELHEPLLLTEIR